MRQNPFVVVEHPEQRARRQIDGMLAGAGWAVQDRGAMNLAAAPGVAVREVPTSAGPADYLLFLGNLLVGVVEAKKAGVTLSTVEAQTRDYAAKAPNAGAPTNTTSSSPATSAASTSSGCATTTCSTPRTCRRPARSRRRSPTTCGARWSRSRGSSSTSKRARRLPRPEARTDPSQARGSTGRGSPDRSQAEGSSPSRAGWKAMASSTCAWTVKIGPRWLAPMTCATLGDR
jgi:hypothetical protein